MVKSVCKCKGDFMVDCSRGNGTIRLTDQLAFSQVTQWSARGLVNLQKRLI